MSRRAKTSGARIVKLPPQIVGAPDVRRERGDVRFEPRALTDDRGRVIGQALGDRRAYLSTHLSRGEIDARQCRAGEAFAGDCEHAQGGVMSALDPRRMEASGRSGVAPTAPPPLSIDRIAASRVNGAIVAIGRPLIEVVIWVALEGNTTASWARHRLRPGRDGMAVLRLALDALAAHYDEIGRFGERNRGVDR